MVALKQCVCNVCVMCVCMCVLWGGQLPASFLRRSLLLLKGSDRQQGCLGQGKDLENLSWQLAVWLGSTWIRGAT